MVRGSGPVVAAAVAMLEQHQQQQHHSGLGLRRVGGVNVLPRATSDPPSPSQRFSGDSSDTSTEGKQSTQLQGSNDCKTDGQSSGNCRQYWPESRREEDGSYSSDDSSSCSGSEHANIRDEHNTTECDDDFQWIQNCNNHEINESRNTDDSPSSFVLREFEEMYNKCTSNDEQESKVVYRKPTSSSLDRHRRSSNRKERDSKAKSSCVNNQQQVSQEKHNLQYPACQGCSSSYQNLPEYRDFHHVHPHYGSTPRLDCYQHPLCCHYPHSIPPPSLCHYDQLYTLRYRMKTPGEADEQVRRLEGDKESLSLQVTVLNDQIEAQTDKIADLEKTVDEHKKQLSNAEDLLQREILSRSSLETQKLELLAVVTELKRQHACLERENVDLRERLGEERRRHKPPPAPRTSPFPQTSTPNRQPQEVHSLNASPSPSPILQNNARKLSCDKSDDNSSLMIHQGGFQNRIGNQQYSSLPRQHHLQSENATTLKNRVAFAETETVVISDTVSEADVSNANGSYAQSSPTPSLQINKARGIKKIFTRMKRSGSGSLDELTGDGEFRRGGVRATANARLGWTTNQTTRSDQPFSEWNTDTLCAWLTELGLDYCTTEARRWFKSGSQLLNATSSEVDKELGIKNPLHRKKLHLALHCERGSVSDTNLTAAGQLGTAWVLRWLDDAGLPQHKDTFLAARVDGRLLHRLTLDDLASLHVTSALQVASIRTGIQVLRTQNFESNCLIRRSSPEESGNRGPGEVALWTNHRVMEWLRAVDLAEYAPNLRGSGVHGGLLVYEPKFTGELLASLLSIPPGKTLLRRHLTTHFKDLLGRDVIQEKREAEASLGYVPLTTTAKIKVGKKSQFTLKRKKSKGELDYGELVCPLDGTRSQGESLQGEQQTQSQSQNSPLNSTTNTTNSSTTTTTVSPLPAAAKLVQNPVVASLESHSGSFQNSHAVVVNQKAVLTDRSSNV